jgi:LPXTG-motif cell wall-anchored protein
VNDNHAFHEGKCLLCGAEEKAPECEHNYEIVKKLEATCVEGGYIWEKCTICGNEHNYETAIVADAHDYESVVTDPTCQSDGFTTHTCKLCGDNFVDTVVEATGHNYKDVVTDATCTEDGKIVSTCEGCGDKKVEVVEAKGHNFVDGKCEHCGEDEVKEPVEEDKEDTDAPQTGDNSMIIIPAFAMLLSAACAIVLGKKYLFRK